MHFELIIFVLLIFGTFGLIGSSVVAVLGARYNSTRRWLLSPFSGMAVVVIVATALLRLGLPVKLFGMPLIAVLMAGNVGYWIFRRPRLDWKRVALWSGTFLAVLVLAGWPLIVGGYDWISTGNGDMTLYLLGANHFHDHGYYQTPPLHDMMRELETSWDFSFFYSIGEVRAASQLILALFMTVASITAAQGYMILLLAVHMIMLSTAAALVCSSAAREKIALVALLVLGSSANLAVGMYVQLMPQDFGLAALAACALVLLDHPGKGKLLLTHAALSGIFLATQLIGYPELLPFIVLAVCIWAFINLLKGSLGIRNWLVFIGATFLATVVLTNTNLPGALHMILWAADSSKSNAALINSLFPYYLTPFGLALGWGFAPLGDTGASTWQAQTYVLAGILLCPVAVFVAIREAFRLEAPAIVVMSMFLAFVALLVEQNGFGLFKLAMYMQPFLLGTLTVAIWRFIVECRPYESSEVPS